MKGKFRFIVQAAALLVVCLGAGLLIRLPGLHYSYFCWDEHDYIAHNIYARCSLGHFEIPYSNKWPLGHALIYVLTRAFDPFSIAGYRFASCVIDAATATMVAIIISGFRRRRDAYIWAVLYILAESVCLRLSPGILAEGMANLPLVCAFAVLLYLREGWAKWLIAMSLLAAACLFKPTAVFPGLGLIVADLWIHRHQPVRENTTQVTRLTGSGLGLLLLLWFLYRCNVWNVQAYFWRSAVVYNTSSSVFRVRPWRDYADVFLTGFAFFQYLIAPAVLAALAIRQSRSRESVNEKNLVIRSVALAIGAGVSLLVRPAGAQTTYWLYLLPPVFALAAIGYQIIAERVSRPVKFAVATIAIAPFLYAWALFVYGQPRNLIFGGHGGVRVIQTQIEDTKRMAALVRQCADYRPGSSRILNWGYQWQIFYFSKTIPATSILTDETWLYNVDRGWQSAQLDLTLAKTADFVVLDAELPPDMEKRLKERFVLDQADQRYSVWSRKKL